jgi:PepSY-associated TM region
MGMRRLIYLSHRWLGVFLSAFMLMWFVSGGVMLYVGYPKLTHLERLAALPDLVAPQCCASLASNLISLRMTTVAGASILIARAGSGQPWAQHPSSGVKVGKVSQSDAVLAAQAFMPGVPVVQAKLVQEDAWTHSKALDVHRPLYRVQMRDEKDSLLYVSSRTGEVVRDATRVERLWNWVGAWIHWLYPFRGGLVDHYWSTIVIWLSILSCVLVVLGAFVGIWRWRFRAPYRSGRHSPYQDFWKRWHHCFGLLFGLISLTFIFSGLMSMNPFKIFDSGAPTLETRQGERNRIHFESFELTPKAAIRTFTESGFQVVEMEWRTVQGLPYYLAFDRNGRTRLLGASLQAREKGVFTSFPIEAMQAMGQALYPGVPIDQVQVLQTYDLHYYAREPHTMLGGEKRLPVLRLKFADVNSTWLHIDPASGSVIQQTDGRRRLSRWLFSFLHSWDWPTLLELRPLWDVWMIALSLGGGVISLSGLVLAWRRLR